MKVLFVVAQLGAAGLQLYMIKSMKQNAVCSLRGTCSYFGHYINYKYLFLN